MRCRWRPRAWRWPCSAGIYIFVLAPIEQQRETAANLYGNTLTRIAQANVRAAKPVATEPVLWARDMMSVGAVMPYDMKLKRLALVQGTGTAGTTFETGRHPAQGRRGQSATDRPVHEAALGVAGLRRRFTEINFAGAGRRRQPRIATRALSRSSLRLRPLR